MSQQKQGQQQPDAKRRKQFWDYTPNFPFKPHPYFEWPMQPFASLIYLLKSWNPAGWRFLMLGFAWLVWTFYHAITRAYCEWVATIAGYLKLRFATSRSFGCLPDCYIYGLLPGLVRDRRHGTMFGTWRKIRPSSISATNCSTTFYGATWPGYSGASGNA